MLGSGGNQGYHSHPKDMSMLSQRSQGVSSPEQLMAAQQLEHQQHLELANALSSLAHAHSSH